MNPWANNWIQHHDARLCKIKLRTKAAQYYVRVVALWMNLLDTYLKKVATENKFLCERKCCSSGCVWVPCTYVCVCVWCLCANGRRLAFVVCVCKPVQQCATFIMSFIFRFYLFFFSFLSFLTPSSGSYSRALLVLRWLIRTNCESGKHDRIQIQRKNEVNSKPLVFLVWKPSLVPSSWEKCLSCTATSQ